MTITNREELEAAFRDEGYYIEPEIVTNVMKSIGVYHDWLTSHGFAVVNLEPTEEMTRAGLRCLTDYEVPGDDPDGVIRAANAKGNILTKREGE